MLSGSKSGQLAKQVGCLCERLVIVTPATPLVTYLYAKKQERLNKGRATPEGLIDKIYSELAFGTPLNGYVVLYIISRGKPSKSKNI